MEVLKIVGVVNADKKNKDKDELAKKENELEELRRKIAELQSLKEENPPEIPTTPDEEKIEQEGSEE